MEYIPKSASLKDFEALSSNVTNIEYTVQGLETKFERIEVFEQTISKLELKV